MNRRFREILNGIGMVLAAFAMMFVGAGLIYLVTMVYRSIFK